ncbi:MAG TPA: family 78 glycoside hydrolase catalytic domain [Candidatus Sulfotelmatobacter sp.]|nr:family 78 glycoside hydrolase catalytic domain [Candidatus Sulfotelmatobacter sp.]
MRRHKRPRIFLAVLCFLLAPIVLGQDSVDRAVWTAQWISHPTAALREAGVFHFRKILELESRPERFMVHVSADNRFILFVNGQRVGEGPAHADFRHWRYESFDLAPFLIAGKNMIAANVWQFGIYAPIAQISDRLAFFMEGDTKLEAAANTDATWEVEQEEGHSFGRAISSGLWQYYAAGPGERIDGTRYDWEWMQPNSASSRWLKAAPAMRESIFPHGSLAVSAIRGGDLRWWLVRDPLPPMEFREVPSGHVVRSTLGTETSFPHSPLVIPANTDARVLLDAGAVLCAYPQLTVSSGRGAKIQAVYAEALYDDKQHRGDRNEVADRVALGLTDEFIPDGADARTFAPLWWRTWRYVEFHIHTADQPLTLSAFKTFYSAYPFREEGEFSSSDPDLAKIREISWRTARLDAHDTYMDTAYWEQLQYVGDTRIQALISYAVSGDDRLARQALLAFDASRIPQGITQSRYPTSLTQLIPPFSLIYVSMLHDYWMYRPDAQFVRDLLPGTRTVLAWFQRHQRSDGFLGPLPYWEFMDWVPGNEEFPPVDHEGRSSLLTLLYATSLHDAAEMEESLGEPSIAAHYREQAHAAAESVYKLCWNAQLGLIADTPDQKEFSQQANSFAVLADAVPLKDQSAVMQKTLDPRVANLTQASYFFQFYITRALDHAGVGDLYLSTLEPWRHMPGKGLTTTPEFADPTRSDTHAWSAHPAYDLTTMLAGIRPGSPGFATVRIQPHLGGLWWLEASMPHPAGSIRASYRQTGNGVRTVIELPPGLTGKLDWKNKQYDLKPGRQDLTLP